MPAKIVSAPSAASARTDHTSARSAAGRGALASGSGSSSAWPGEGRRGAPGEQGGGRDDQHRQREVAHHPAVVEIAAHGEAPEDRLADHAEWQQPAEPDEIAPVGSPAQRQKPGGAGGDRDRHGQQSVGELDQGMRIQRRIDVAVALRPGRAAETGPGQPHGGAGEHDQGERDERRVRDIRVLTGRDRVAIGALAQALDPELHWPKSAKSARSVRPQRLPRLDNGRDAADFGRALETRATAPAGERRPRRCLARGPGRGA